MKLELGNKWTRRLSIYRHEFAVMRILSANTLIFKIVICGSVRVMVEVGVIITSDPICC